MGRILAVDVFCAKICPVYGHHQIHLNVPWDDFFINGLARKLPLDPADVVTYKRRSSTTKRAIHNGVDRSAVALVWLPKSAI